MTPRRKMAMFHRLRAFGVISASLVLLWWLKGWKWAVVVGVVAVSIGLVNEVRWRRGQELVGGEGLRPRWRR